MKASADASHAWVLAQELMGMCSQLSAAEGEGEKKMWNSATIVRQILNLYFYLVVLIK